MRKGIKILGKVFAAVILLLLAVPLLLSLLLEIPAVQNFAVQKAVGIVSRKLETVVSIDRVDIGLFSKLRVDGFYVEDYQKDTMLFVGRIDAYVTGLGLFGGGLSLGRAEMTDAKLYLRETPEGEMNIKQIVARISNPDKPKKGNFRLTIGAAAIHGMDFCLERLARRDPPYGIDFGHMHLYGIEARIEDFTIDGQAIHTSIEALAARERSGFAIEDLTGRFYLNSGCMGFEEATIRTARSSVVIPYISLVGNSWAEYKDFVHEVRLDGALRRTRLATDDVAYFSPRLRDWHLVVSDVDLDVAGTVSDLTARIGSLRLGEGTSLAGDVAIAGLPDAKNARFDVTVPHLRTSAAAVDRLLLQVADRSLPANLAGILGHAGEVDIDFVFKGMLSSFDLRLGAATDVGRVSANLQMKPLDGGRQRVQGDVAARSLRLGKLLGKSDLLGDATLSAWVDGTVGKGLTDAYVAGNIAQLGFNDYVYDSLRLDGRVRNREFDGRITARDPNLDFDFLGMVDWNGSMPLYDFTLDLHRADLAALHFNRRDSVSVLSARLAAKAGGRSLDDLNGRIQVTDAVYRYNDKRVEARNLTVTGENSATHKLIELRSDFADATFRSRTSYREVFAYLRQSAWKYLPLLRDEEKARDEVREGAAVADDYSLLSVSIRDFNPVADAVSPGLQIADGSSLQLLFNPASDKLSLKANSEYIERGRMLVTRLSVNASNRADSLAFYASAEDLYAGALHLPHLSVTGGARQGRIQLSTGFNDTLRRFSGLLGVRASVAREDGPNGRVVDLRILPSHITRADKTWQIFARKIQIDTTQVAIDRFFVKNGQQELLLDGIASRRESDSLTLRMRDFDVATFSQIFYRMGYRIGGRTSGEATMKSVLHAGEFSADILFDSLSVNGIAGPPLRLVSRWDLARNRAGVSVMNRTRGDTLVRGFYDPGQVRYYARATIDDLDMGLLDPVLSGVVSSTSGRASADLTLQGRGRDAELTGRIRVDSLRTTVDFTQVTYTLPRADMEVRNNRFRVVNVPLYDPEGNEGRLDLELNLQHLSNIAYDLRVAPHEMLVLNTTDRDNDVFYGHVFASGTARISGDKGQVTMDVAATTDGNSTFFMPLSSKSNISNADFVTFLQPVRVDTTDNLARKKMLFERKRKQKTEGGSRMNISLALNVRPNILVGISVSGNDVKARGEGLLNLQINPRQNVFEMYGDFTIAEGTYQLSLQNLIRRDFTIESGSTIQWTGSPLDALLNIEAIYRLKASLQPLLTGSATRDAQQGATPDRSVPVECVIYLKDRLSHPAITFDVRVSGTDPEMQTLIANALTTPEEVDTQFLALLMFNSFLAENSLTSSSNIGASVSAGAGLEFLSNMLSNMLSGNDYSVFLRYRPKSEQTGMGDEVEVGFSKSLINNRLFVELEGNYIGDTRQAVNSNMSNFMGEAYITYLLDRAGTLRLRAFTQTIDRFDENQGLQETGIGIYFKEDFDNLRDLRRRIRDRFTNKKRKARREARRAARRAERAAADSLKRVAASGPDAVPAPETFRGADVPAAATPAEPLPVASAQKGQPAEAVPAKPVRPLPADPVRKMPDRVAASAGESPAKPRTEE